MFIHSFFVCGSGSPSGKPDPDWCKEQAAIINANGLCNPDSFDNFMRVNCPVYCDACDA